MGSGGTCARCPDASSTNSIGPNGLIDGALLVSAPQDIESRAHIQLGFGACRLTAPRQPRLPGGIGPPAHLPGTAKPSAPKSSLSSANSGRESRPRWWSSSLAAGSGASRRYVRTASLAAERTGLQCDSCPWSPRTRRPIVGRRPTEHGPRPGSLPWPPCPSWALVCLPAALGKVTFYYRDLTELFAPTKAFGRSNLHSADPRHQSDWARPGIPWRPQHRVYPDNLLYLVLPFWSAFNLHLRAALAARRHLMALLARARSRAAALMAPL